MTTRRNLVFASLVLLGSLFGGISFVKAYQVGDTMTLSTAEKRWGRVPFSAEKFKVGTTEVRASMAVDLIKSKVMLGKRSVEVFSTLGKSSGHFFSDLVPAYFLNEGWKTNEDTWQLVFLLKEENSIVAEVIIQKNCCRE